MNLELELKDIVQIAEAVVSRMPQQPRTKWLTRSEAADHLRCSTKQIDLWVRVGDLPVYRPNSKPLFSTEDLDEFVHQNRREF